MKTLIAVLFLATIVAAVPVPAGNKKADQQFYVSSIPLDPVGLYGYPVGPSAAVPYTLPQQFVDPYNIVPVKNVQAPVKDQVTLMLSVPAVVPPGTSVTVTVNVANKNPETGTVVSVSNPVVSTPGASLTPTSNEAVVIDANTGSGPSIIDTVQFPDDLDNREPPLIVNLPFDNPKDSPVLVALQGEAIKQQMMAALATRKTA